MTVKRREDPRRRRHPSRMPGAVVDHAVVPLGERFGAAEQAGSIRARRFADLTGDVYNTAQARSGAEESKLTLPIVFFLVFGACFGLVTCSNRHLFSEGPTGRDEQGRNDPMNGRVMWVLICTFLWPIMALTGLHSWWILARRRALAVRSKRD